MTLKSGWFRIDVARGRPNIVAQFGTVLYSAIEIARKLKLVYAVIKIQNRLFSHGSNDI